MNLRNELVSAIIRAPMLRAAVPFIAGLVLGRVWWLPLSMAWGAVVLLGAGWLIVAFRPQQYRARWVTGVVFGCFLFGFGLLWQRLHTPEHRDGHVGQYVDRASGWMVTVEEVASMTPRTVRTWVKVQAALIGQNAQPASGKLLVTLMRDTVQSIPAVGDRLLLSAKAVPITQIPDPGGFDARRWAAERGAHHACFAPIGQWAFVGQRSAHAGFFEHARMQITDWLHTCDLPNRERALVKAILLGLRDELEPDQNQAFVQSGTIHALAVSGSHVGIIYIAVLWALSFMGKGRWASYIRACLILAALWFYAGLTGFSPSVLRATLMFSLFTLAEASRWRAGSLNSLACAAILLLLWDPSMLVQLGFQLSFLAVLGIIIFYQPVHALWVPSTVVGRFLWSLMAVSIVAQVFTLPLCLYVFHAFPVWFLPANMAIVGLVGLGVYGGVLLLGLHAVPVLGAFITALMAWLLMLLGWLSSFFSSLPGAYPAVRIGFWGMLGLYLLIAFASLWFMQGSRWTRSLSLAMVALLLFGWAWTAHQRNTQVQFALYAGRDGPCCAIVKGRSLHVFISSATPWTERSIREHARSAGARLIHRTDSLPFKVLAPDRQYVFMPLDHVPLEQPMPITPVTTIWYGSGPPNGSGWTAGNQQEWVLAGDLKANARRKMIRWASNHGIPVHDIRMAGAYVRP